MKHFKLLDKAINNMIMRANSFTLNDIWQRVEAILNYSVPLYILDNETLAHIIDISSDWEFCKIYGFLGELSERTNADFINEYGEFDDSLVYDAMEKLGYRV